MKTLQACTLIAIFLLGFSVAGVSASTNTTFGGKSGDWIEYGLTQYSVSIPSSGPSEWVSMDFLSVEGANVTVNGTLYTSNFLIENETMTIDLTSQNPQNDFQLGWFNARAYFIPAGLNIADPVYLGQPFGTQNITGETTESYAGADRTVIFTNFTIQENNFTVNNYVLYWDKQTGVLTEGLEYLGNATGAAAYNDVLVTDTNMWSPPVIWPVLLWVAIALAIVLGVMSSRRSVSKKVHRKGNTKPTLTKTNFFLSFRRLREKGY